MAAASRKTSQTSENTPARPNGVTQSSRPALSTKQAAEFLGMSPSTLQNWRSQGQGPSFIRYSYNRVSYLMEDLEAFREAHYVRMGA